MRTLQRSAIATGSAAILLVVLGRSAWAATINVNDTNDELDADGSCSLREAIQSANTDTGVDGCSAGSGADTLLLPAGTYTLSIAPVGDADDNLSGDLDILSDVSLLGADRETTIIDGAQLDRVLQVLCVPDGGNCLGVTTVNISGLTIRNGSALDIGGGLRTTGNGFNSPATTVDNCRFTGNAAVFSGGGVSNLGQLTVLNSVIDANTSGDRGAGLFSQGVASIQDTRISDNASSTDAGGIYNDGVLTVQRALIEGNTALGDGAGLYDVFGESTLTNVSLIGNQAGDTGGGIAAFLSAVRLSHCTISGNVGSGAAVGGILNFNSTVTLTNTLVAGNSAPDVSGAFTSADFNLVQDVGSATGFIGQNDQIAIDPLLDSALADNGGRLQTLALLANSPAIDAGSCSDNDAAPVTDDQRRVARPSGLTCDIGAFEVATILELVGVSAEAAGANCAEGGARIDVGEDLNRNGTIEIDEATDTQFACNGALGQEGAAGATGATGADGATGLLGPAGVDGADGATGLQGPAGVDGADGADGATGLQGPAGVDGADGGTGLQGPPGADGATGADGAGSTGPRGPAGDTGAPGPDGAASNDGVPGMNGTDGADGSSSIARLTELVVGDERCPGGGQLIEVGADTNGDSALADSEVQSASPLCAPEAASLSEDDSCSVSNVRNSRASSGWGAGLLLFVATALRRRWRTVA
jgi:CSLREA domain-containing protein